MYYIVDYGIVDVYYMQIQNCSDEKACMLYKALNDEEVFRLEKMKSKKRKNTFILSRYILRQLLDHQFCIGMRNIGFFRNEYGKMYIEDDINGSYKWPIYFNLSHSDNVLALAVSACYDIGVDVEKIDRNFTNVAYSFFSKAEVKYLKDLSEEVRQRELCKLWTLKEAYVKAKGMGLTIPLDSFNVNEYCGMFTYSIELVKDYYLSIAVDCKTKEGFKVRIREINVNDICCQNHKLDFK